MSGHPLRNDLAFGFCWDSLSARLSLSCRSFHMPFLRRTMCCSLLPFRSFLFPCFSSTDDHHLIFFLLLISSFPRFLFVVVMCSHEPFRIPSPRDFISFCPALLFSSCDRTDDVFWTLRACIHTPLLVLPTSPPSSRLGSGVY